MTGDYIKKERKKRKMKQSDLAAILGVTSRTIINWEKGENLSPQNLKMLHLLFNNDTYKVKVLHNYMKELQVLNQAQNDIIRSIIEELE